MYLTITFSVKICAQLGNKMYRHQCNILNVDGRRPLHKVRDDMTIVDQDSIDRNVLNY